MGFAEQLAAKAAEAKSHRERSDLSVSSLGTNGSNNTNRSRTRVRKPRIRPIDDDGCYSCSDEKRGGSDEKRDGAFVDQLKQRAAKSHEGNNVNNAVNAAVQPPIPVQMLRAQNPTINSSQTNSQSDTVTEKQVQMRQFLQQMNNLQKVDLEEHEKMHKRLRQSDKPDGNGGQTTQPNEVDSSEEDNVISDAWAQMSWIALKPPNKSLHNIQRRQPDKLLNQSPSSPVQVSGDGENEDFSPLSKQILQKANVDMSAAVSIPASNNSIKPASSANNNNIKPASPQNNSANSHKQTEAPISPNTRAIFGAWAQIESLQQRLKEAEARADKEMRRAEIAEKRGFGSVGVAGAAGANTVAYVEGADLAVGVAVDVADGNKAAVQQKSSSDASSSKLDGSNREFNAKESTESMETVALVVDEDSHLTSAPNTSCVAATSQPKSSTDNNELNKWKRRAIEAEDRLSKHDYSVLISSQKPKQKTVDPDLIQLKNAEIDLLRHQISRLELCIREECQRNADIMAYRNEIHHLDPPIAVAECTTANGTTSRECEFRMLRNEIRHLQNQLSRKNNNATTTSVLSTTGSTLSSLENENEEADEEVTYGSSWGYLCCVRRSRRGYGRVTG